MEAAFFDLDKTVVSKSSSLALSRPFYRAGLVTRSQLLRGVYAQLVYLMIGADEKRMDRAKDGLLAEKEGIDLRGSYAYSDSVTDGPMLEAVGNPVAVNPDRELRRLAQQRGWKVRDFRRPVRLRHRLADVRRPTPGTVAIGAATVAAVLAWLYLRGRLARPQPAEPRPGELRLVDGGKRIGSRRRKLPPKGAEPTLGLPREAVP